jgi:hypothetical protein
MSIEEYYRDRERCRVRRNCIEEKPLKGAPTSSWKEPSLRGDHGESHHRVLLVLLGQFEGSAEEGDCVVELSFGSAAAKDEPAKVDGPLLAKGPGTAKSADQRCS